MRKLYHSTDKTGKGSEKTVTAQRPVKGEIIVPNRRRNGTEKKRAKMDTKLDNQIKSCCSYELELLTN